LRVLREQRVVPTLGLASPSPAYHVPVQAAAPPGPTTDHARRCWPAACVSSAMIHGQPWAVEAAFWPPWRLLS